MTVETFVKEFDFSVLCIPSPDKEIEGVYIGDLLSWVMGKAECGNVWITIMSNINVLAVASLADVACVLLAEDVKPDEEILSAAKDKGINILSSRLSAFEIAKKISSMI